MNMDRVFIPEMAGNSWLSQLTNFFQLFTIEKSSTNHEAAERKKHTSIIQTF